MCEELARPRQREGACDGARPLGERVHVGRVHDAMRRLRGPLDRWLGRGWPYLKERWRYDGGDGEWRGYDPRLQCLRIRPEDLEPNQASVEGREVGRWYAWSGGGEGQGLC